MGGGRNRKWLGVGGREKQEVAVTEEYSVSLGDDENVLDPDSGDGCTTL